MLLYQHFCLLFILYYIYFFNGFILLVPVREYGMVTVLRYTDGLIIVYNKYANNTKHKYYESMKHSSDQGYSTFPYLLVM